MKMSYKSNKSALSDIRKKYREAKSNRDKLIERRNTIDADVRQAYDTFIQAQANAIIDDATKSKQAESKFQSLKAERDDLDKKLDVAEKVLKLVRSKVKKAEADFRLDARKYHQDKLAPHFSKIDQALSTINAEIDTLNEYRRELTLDNLDDSILQGIKHHSQAVITKENNGSLGMRKFITTMEYGKEKKA